MSVSKNIIVYVDGFNLYYCSLKRTKYKWLNLMMLSQNLFPKDNIIGIKYYTARVSNKVSLTAPRDQQVYFNALNSIPNLDIVYGNFQQSEKIMHLATPLYLYPQPQYKLQPTPSSARVVKFEEKGSDVNLGVQLVRDAFQGKFERAVVITNDSDLKSAIEIVTQEVNLPVTLVSPYMFKTKPNVITHPKNTSLKLVSTDTILLQPNHVANSQFLDSFSHNGKLITKPVGW